MGCVVWDITEERFIFVLLDEGHGLVGEVVGDVSFASDDFAVAFEDRVEVMSPVAGAEAVIFVESAGVGVVGVLCSIVPFAEGSGCVAGGFEGVGDGFFVDVHSFRSGADAVDSGSSVVATGEKLCSGWCADGADIEAVEDRSVPDDRVDIRGREVCIAVDAEVSEALVIA